MAPEHESYSPQDTGARLKALRRSSRRTQAGLAAEMARRDFAWHQNTTWRVEKGLRRITLEEAGALAEIFGVPLNGLGLAA